jgi:hypothetical protein
VDGIKVRLPLLMRLCSCCWSCSCWCCFPAVGVL